MLFGLIGSANRKRRQDLKQETKHHEQTMNFYLKGNTADRTELTSTSQRLGSLLLLRSRSSAMRLNVDSCSHSVFLLLSVEQVGLFNFRPSVRPVPLEVHIHGFPGQHYCPRMATMNKPTFQGLYLFLFIYIYIYMFHI